jgi:hypothetical protein
MSLGAEEFEVSRVPESAVATETRERWQLKVIEKKWEERN